MARIIDTSVFVELERKGLSLDVIASGALAERHAIASITAAELLYGVAKANTPERQRRRSEFAEAILANIPVFPLDVATARAQARVWAALETTGERIGPYDLIVAATAVAQGYDVFTFNVRGFERVPGLAVIRPEW